jgi:hypothetical protein
MKSKNNLEVALISAITPLLLILAGGALSNYFYKKGFEDGYERKEIEIQQEKPEDYKRELNFKNSIYSYFENC